MADGWRFWQQSSCPGAAPLRRALMPRQREGSVAPARLEWDRGRVYVTWGGTLGSVEQEIWQNGVSLAGGAPGDTPAFPTLTQAQALMASLQTQWTAGANQTMSWCKLKWIKL